MPAHKKIEQPYRRLAGSLVLLPVLFLLAGILFIENNSAFLLSRHFRWMLELFAVGFLVIEGAGVWYLLHRRWKAHQHVQQMNQMYALRIKLDDLFDLDCSATELMQSVCDLLAHEAGFALCIIASPDENPAECLSFKPIVHSGNPTLLTCLINPDEAGAAWQTGETVFSACTPPVREAHHPARPYLPRRQAIAILPIRVGGKIQALLGIADAPAERFDISQRQFLQESAHDLGRRLTSLEVQRQNSELNADLIRVQSYHQGLFERNAASMLIVDATRHIRDVNPAFCRLTGYDRSLLLGQTTDILMPDARSFKKLGELCQLALQSDTPTPPQEGVIVDRQGKKHPVQLMGSRVTLQDQTIGVIWSWLDLTELNEVKAALDHQATHDLLTGLPNRLALERHLHGAVERAQRSERALAVGFADLDGFKAINDQWGHAAGDELLRILADRWHQVMRNNDLVARLGGDEFVFVFENLSTEAPEVHLNHIFLRIEQTVKTPVVLDSGQTVRVGISMGVALYPKHAEEEDTLLRVADMAMYQSKNHKLDRKQWWQIGVDSDVQMDDPHEIDPFGQEAKDLLREYSPNVDAVIGQFVEAFYSGLGQEVASQEILVNLSESQLQHLKQKQAEHLRFMLDPDATETAITARAAHTGKVHALVGLNNSLLLRSLSLYEDLLQQYIAPVISTLRERYTMSAIITRRILLDIHAEMDAQNATQAAYIGFGITPLPTWNLQSYHEIITEEMNALAQLPGIAAAIIYRPDPNGLFRVIQAAGNLGEPLAQLLHTPGFEISIDDNIPQGLSNTSVAWRERRIISAPSYLTDPHYKHWHSEVATLGIRSHLAIPILDKTRNPDVVLCLYGSFPNQFESPVMRQFAEAAQYRFNEIQARASNVQTTTIALEQSREWLRLLFTGGLRMFMQPILDLNQRRVTKVEALARIALPEGRILTPNYFLPLLGDSELNRLFVMGLESTLSYQARWLSEGVALDVSVNLPTQALLQADCVQWVQAALQRHQTPARALTLELLETGAVTEGMMGRTLNGLRQLGVRLAMDDLGSGYSSLLRLAELPFDCLKIDQGIMVRIHQTPLEIFSVISAINQMGESFERQIIAEGLEDFGMFEAAMILGVDFAQGYCIAKPLHADELMTWLTHYIPPFEQQTEIHTALGALAYFWLSTRNGRKHLQLDAKTCRLNAYFKRQNLSEDSEPVQWHQLSHDVDSVAALSAMLHLKNWLVEHARTERIMECPQ